MPDDVYKKYSMRSEHSLFVEIKENTCGSASACNNFGKMSSTLWIEDKLWLIIIFLTILGLGDLEIMGYSRASLCNLKNLKAS